MLGVTLISLMVDIQGSLVLTPFTVYSPRLKDKERKEYVGSTLVHQVGLSLLAVLGLGLGEIFGVFRLLPTGLTLVSRALMAVITLIMLRDYVRRILFAALEPRKALQIDIYASLLQLGGLALLASSGLISASWVFCVMGLASGIATVWWLILNRDAVSIRPTLIPLDFKRNWSLGKWTFASAALWAVSMNAYPWLLAVLRGTAAAGTWAACVGVSSIGSPLLLGAQNILGSKNSPCICRRGKPCIEALCSTGNIVSRFCHERIFFPGVCFSGAAFGSVLRTHLFAERIVGGATCAKLCTNGNWLLLLSRSFRNRSG